MQTCLAPTLLPDPVLGTKDTVEKKTKSLLPWSLCLIRERNNTQTNVLENIIQCRVVTNTMQTIKAAEGIQSAKSMLF